MAFLTDLFSTTSILSKKSFVPFSILALALIGNFSWHSLRVVNKGYFFNTPIKFCIKFFFYGNPTDILSFSSILTVPPNTCCINNNIITFSRKFFMDIIIRTFICLGPGQVTVIVPSPSNKPTQNCLM